MRKFPENPQNCNPIQLINQLKPGVRFTEVVISAKTPSLFQVKCEIDDIPFSGQGNILCNIILITLCFISKNNSKFHLM